MSICQQHWDALREKIIEVGLGSLISESGQEVAAKIEDQFRNGPVTIDNYDPLMNAYFSILTNGGDMVESAGGNPLYVMMDGDEDSMDESLEHYAPKFQIKYAGKTWPRCTICYLSIVHELTCKSGCDLPSENGYDWMIEKAAEEEVKHWKAMNDAR